MSGNGKPSAYSLAGVDYASLDAGKRLALIQALTTSDLLADRGGAALDASRGQPAFVFEFEGRALAFVMEGLGTKSIIARHYAEQTGMDRFGLVAYDTVAAIVNDLCCVGALPLVVNAYFATGSSDWYRHEDRVASLLEGWRQACSDAGCTWGGGESPSLPELVALEDIELAGSAIGAVPKGCRPVLGADLAAGDEIVLIESTGLHANGSSLARALVDALPDRYATPLPSGTSVGEALLTPSAMYVPLIERLLAEDVRLTYLSHITGHGFLKLMRPTQRLTYRITSLLPVPEIFDFLKSEAGMTDHAAYSIFNMGCGFAVYCAAGHGDAVVAHAHDLGLQAVVAGAVEEGPRQVVLDPLDITYASNELRLSPGS